jgi:UDP-3-O-[3-hydroxymyristoyl] glucosamine N-acyltransferase
MQNHSVTPAELLSSNASDRLRRLRVCPERASTYASRLGLGCSGSDLEIDSFRPLSALDEADREDRAPVTYLTARRFAEMLLGRSGLTVVTTADLQSCVPAGNGVLLTKDEPRSTYYSILETARNLGYFESLETFVSPSARVSPSAVVSSNVYISDNAEIGSGVVLLPNTYVGPGVVIKPNAVIGGDGFEVVSGLSGKGRRMVPHLGGVWLSEGVHVGSCTCIDKGVNGDFTYIGSQTFLDNLVHIAHCARVGQNCSITAGVGIHGSAVVEDGVWVGPNAQINSLVHVAEYCYIGIGSILIRDVEAHRLVLGSPARPIARVCVCRNKLAFEKDRSQCDICGRQFLLVNGRVQRQ